MNHFPAQVSLAALLLLFALTHVANAQETAVPSGGASATSAEPVKATPPVVGTRRALVICGLSGDAEHYKLFGDAVQTLHTGLTAYHQFKPENIRILWGAKPTDKDPVAIRASLDVTTRESIAATIAAVRGELAAEDALWVFVIGHTHFDGKYSWLNLSGPDLNNQEFGQAFSGLTCREQVFFMTTASSGYFIKPLAQAGRIVISATEADQEVNETLFPQKLVRTIGSPPPLTDLDMDRDGQFSLYDLYLFTAREVDLEYTSGELLATEHSLLDDNADGRGSELQADYLTVEQGGRRRPGSKQPLAPQGDGKLSHQVLLLLPLELTRPSSPLAPPLPIDA